MRPVVRALIVLLLAGSAAACSVDDPVVDTWPVGKALDCAPGDARCAELLRVGLEGLRSRDVQRSELVSARLYSEGAFRDVNTGGLILVKRSGGCCQVLVAMYADRTVRAIGVGYPGVSTTAME